MSSQGGSGFNIGDLVQVWIAAAVSLSAFFAWLLWKVTRLGTFQSLPNVRVEAQGGSPPRLIRMQLEGPNADRWQIASAAISKPRDVQFLGVTMVLDNYGGGDWSIGEPVGRTMLQPPIDLALSSLESPVLIMVKLSLKAFPRITSLHPITVKSAA